MNHILKMMVMFIVSVAVYDIYCTVALHDSMLHCEENPVALLLINRTETIVFAADPWKEDSKLSVTVHSADVSRLVAVKAAGLSASIPLMLHVIQSHRQSVAAAIIIPIAVGAAILLARLVH